MKTYKVAEASDIIGFSQQVIYKYLDYFSDLFHDNIENREGVTVLTEKGIHILEEIKSLKESDKTRLKDIKEALYKNRKDRFTKNVEESTETEKEVLREQIDFLREQLKKKDEQLEIKDEQIAELHQIIALQERNSLGQQKLLEDMSGKSLWKRLKTAFGLKNPHRSDTGF